MPIYNCFWLKTKNDVFCRELANTRLTKELMAFFAPAESLPTPATLDNIKLFPFVLQGIGEHVQLRRFLNTERLFRTDCPLCLDPELHFPCQACSCLLRCHTRQHKKAWQKDKT